MITCVHILYIVSAVSALDATRYEPARPDNLTREGSADLARMPPITPKEMALLLPNPNSILPDLPDIPELSQQP